MAALRTLAVCALFGLSRCQSSDCSYSSLFGHLNISSSNEVLQIMRPVRNWTSATVVQLHLQLLGILDVDEKLQTVSLHIGVDMYWTDEFLTWNASEFCGIDFLTVPRSILWIPDIAIREDTSDVDTVLQDPFAILYPSGLVKVSERKQLTYTCQLDLFLFPFDIQRCNMTFESMSSDVQYIRITATEEEMTGKRPPGDFLKSQGEWKLKTIQSFEFLTVNVKSSKSNLVYMVLFQRRPFLYIINLIMPLLFLLVLDLASFFIGEARGEKLNFKVTVLLSIFVLLLILQDILPSTEENLPMMAIYCVAIFTMVWISVLEAMLVSFLIGLDGCCDKKSQNHEEDEPDIQLEAISQESSHPESAEKEAKPDPPLLDLPADLLKQILAKLKATQQQLRSQDGEVGGRPGCYIKIAKIIDYLFFVFYLLSVVIFQLTSFTIWLPNVFK